MTETATLRKKIYAICLNLSYLKDSDNVKLLRDDTSNKLFSRPESELNDYERKRLIGYLLNRKPARVFCTRRQSNTVRNLALEYAIYYYNYKDLTVLNKLGEPMLADDIKLMIQEQYKKDGYAALSTKIKITLFENSANPKCRNLLIDAGMRTRVGSSTIFYYDRMTHDEADYLIKRFTKLLAKTKMIRPLGVTNQISNN